LHALKHFGSSSDAAGTPSQHIQVCLECASFAPLAGAHGGHPQVLVLEFVATVLLAWRAGAALVSCRDTRPFQARAPPR
jgi:hypothetical protein